MGTWIEDTVRDILAQVGDSKVLCTLSVIVDSSVVAMLLHKAVGAQLTCMFIDHGLLRKGEAKSIMETFVGKFDMKVVKIDVCERSLSKLVGIYDSEQKRKIIGNEFICQKKGADPSSHFMAFGSAPLIYVFEKRRTG